MAREATAEGEPEAARVCAERVKEVGVKVLEYDSDNPRALGTLERLSEADIRQVIRTIQGQDRGRDR
jgi:hypothetical protein